ncbi:TPM domain-containing protein [Xanthomonas medicagonis]|uniref:TPM domain-containing protein n=1 Tax=Xanthomonas medicagonis TaxID=3160841 RepID=UPI003516A2F2
MRILRHLFAPSARAVFPDASLQRIGAAIAEGERLHRGQVMFAVEAGLAPAQVLRGMAPRLRAEHAFAQLRTWDTDANNGVLIYLLLADHHIEIVADRGLRGRVDAAQWREVCAVIERDMRAGQPEQAVIAGVGAVSALLATHFPAQPGQDGEDELPNLPRVLD